MWCLNLTKKLFFLDQHGCAKNQVDGELIINRLSSLGMKQTLDPKEADLIIINSCGFIESAKKESLTSLLSARSSYPKAKILLAGCLAERYTDTLKEELFEADGIFGNGDISLIDQAVKDIFKKKRPIIKSEQKGVCSGERETLLSFKGSAFVKITEGCDNHCSFCAIPLIRGKLRSRKIDDIIEEIKSLLAKGIFEINLIGQDLAAFGCGKEDIDEKSDKNWHEILYTKLKSPVFTDLSFKKKYGESPLCSLLKKLSSLKGTFWIRLLYIHPDHFNPDILDIMKKDKRFLPYFDIPFQSGSDKIIQAMARKGKSEEYLSLVKKIREVFPESCIRVTFLTGFPGEDEESAKESEAFMKKINCDWAGTFQYSKEEGTRACKMKNQVPKKISKMRNMDLIKTQDKITKENLKKRCGKIYNVLIEEIIENPKEKDDGLALGRPWFCAPEVDGNFVIQYDASDANIVKKIVPGAVIKAKAISSTEIDIEGVVVE